MASFLKNLFRGKTPLSSNRPNYTMKNNTRKVNAMINPMLLKKQVDLELLQAVQNGSVVAAMDALDKGANPNAMTANGSTPLFLLIVNKDKYFGNSLSNRANLVDILLQKGANIHLKKQYGNYELSALELAALKNDIDVLEVLLNYGDYSSNLGRKNIARAHNLAVKRGFNNAANKLYVRKQRLSNASDPGNNNASDPGSVGGAKRKTRRRKRTRTQKRRV